MDIDFYEDKRFGPFGIISRKDYRELNAEERKFVDDIGYSKMSEDSLGLLEKMSRQEELLKRDRLKKNVPRAKYCQKSPKVICFFPSIISFKFMSKT